EVVDRAARVTGRHGPAVGGEDGAVQPVRGEISAEAPKESARPGVPDGDALPPVRDDDVPAVGGKLCRDGRGGGFAGAEALRSGRHVPGVDGVINAVGERLAVRGEHQARRPRGKSSYR